MRSMNSGESFASPLGSTESQEEVLFMNRPSITPEAYFAMVVEDFFGNPDVTLPSDGIQSRKGFGSSALKTHNKIFAMLVRDKFVVKLPKLRVDALIASGDGERYDPRHDGRLMKEWVVIEPTSKEGWLPLAREAMEFVSSQR